MTSYVIFSLNIITMDSLFVFNAYFLILENL